MPNAIVAQQRVQNIRLASPAQLQQEQMKQKQQPQATPPPYPGQPTNWRPTGLLLLVLK